MAEDVYRPKAPSHHSAKQPLSWRCLTKQHLCIIKNKHKMYTACACEKWAQTSPKQP